MSRICVIVGRRGVLSTKELSRNMVWFGEYENPLCFNGGEVEDHKNCGFEKRGHEARPSCWCWMPGTKCFWRCWCLELALALVLVQKRDWSSS